MSTADPHKVNPSHSKTTKEPDEPIPMFDLDFTKVNAAKYIPRAGKKEGAAERDDLLKGPWYIERRLLGQLR